MTTPIDEEQEFIRIVKILKTFLHLYVKDIYGLQKNDRLSFMLNASVNLLCQVTAEASLNSGESQDDIFDIVIHSIKEWQDSYLKNNRYN